ncbi:MULTISPECIES: hypothetical protein [unclassified Streptomyces]|uniref:hypothetical protein n=1 Tax=unclassified Streptomyces TaxID=2593676 RepID=UPI002DDBAB2C|nr:hypothetical protein [Streptomyces sp. NBC_01795]WSA92241.1 hypothetical protein OIE63_12170 [Streptomyces sp. NBC_01795]WSS43949.1 hypothetical protein OG220_27705 [Streptomyces sp. NBC_01187]
MREYDTDARAGTVGVGSVLLLAEHLDPGVLVQVVLAEHLDPGVLVQVVAEPAPFRLVLIQSTIRQRFQLRDRQ